MRKAIFKKLFIVVTLLNFRIKSSDKIPRFDLFVIIFKFKISQYLRHFHVNIILEEETLWYQVFLIFGDVSPCIAPLSSVKKNKFYICFDLENLQAIK